MITKATDYLGKEVEVVIDRPLGSKHPKHGFIYEVNYGYISNTKSSDGEELDVYYLGINKPVRQAKGICIAVIHRTNDDDDKLVVVPEGVKLTDEEIKKQAHFQEQWFQHEIVRSEQINKQTVHNLERFKELIREIDNQFFFCVMGGIAVDGYAKKLTRDHLDVDMLIFREDLAKTEVVLEKLGYKTKRFIHLKESDLEYKMQTGDEDHLFSFQIIDTVDKDKFEISFYRDPRMIFPLPLIKPPVWVKLKSIKFPAVKKEFLIRLKENEAGFFDSLIKGNPAKYQKRKQKHKNTRHDLELLRK